ncbi:hypothetical protein BJX61DRAFT_85474 [Aspergillus egyptiacus]|nr:hypothetical protein BJX61DRAFT_85474 [Aspergillus egyptiacus]
MQKALEKEKRDRIFSVENFSSLLFLLFSICSHLKRYREGYVYYNWSLPGIVYCFVIPFLACTPERET